MGKIPIVVDETEPVGEIEPPFESRDVQIKRGLNVRDFFEMEKEIGRGKFGTVYKCREKSTGLRLAAKFVQAAKKADRASVEREVEIMKSLRNPRLIQLYDAYDDGKKEICLLLELIEGGELFERVIDDDFVLTERACAIFMRQICEGIQFIHLQHVLHLDMKPENILCLTREGNRIKLIDFGLARRYDPSKKLQVLFGTPEFVAPEVVNFESISYGTDMWSVGIICYVLLSGLSPFMGETDVETMANVTIAKYDFDDEAFNDVSAEAKDFISKLLVKQISKRMTANECLRHPWLRIRPPLPVKGDTPELESEEEEEDDDDEEEEEEEEDDDGTEDESLPAPLPTVNGKAESPVPNGPSPVSIQVDLHTETDKVTEAGHAPDVGQSNRVSGDVKADATPQQPAERKKEQVTQPEVMPETEPKAAHKDDVKPEIVPATPALAIRKGEVKSEVIPESPAKRKEDVKPEIMPETQAIRKEDVKPEALGPETVARDVPAVRADAKSASSADKENKPLGRDATKPAREAKAPKESKHKTPLSNAAVTSQTAPPPPPPPSSSSSETPAPEDVLQLTKVNLRQFVERWNSHPNSPFNTACTESPRRTISLLISSPVPPADVSDSPDSMAAMSPSPQESPGSPKHPDEPAPPVEQSQQQQPTPAPAHTDANCNQAPHHAVSSSRAIIANSVETAIEQTSALLRSVKESLIRQMESGTAVRDRTGARVWERKGSGFISGSPTSTPKRWAQTPAPSVDLPSNNNNNNNINMNNNIKVPVILQPSQDGNQQPHQQQQQPIKAATIPPVVTQQTSHSQQQQQQHTLEPPSNNKKVVRQASTEGEWEEHQPVAAKSFGFAKRHVIIGSSRTVTVTSASSASTFAVTSKTSQIIKTQLHKP